MTVENYIISSSLLSHLSAASFFSTIILLLSPGIFFLIYRDYADYISLGPGGTPQTILGYLRIKFFCLFALRNPLDPGPMPIIARQPYIKGLPTRQGDRPHVSGIAPHRQTNQRELQDVFKHLTETLLKLAREHGAELVEGRSCLEKHGSALFALAPVVPKHNTHHCAGEVCHAHSVDGSMHLTLHPADARRVVLQGWGERHPLSSGGWLANFVPPGFLMIYAPRNMEELEIVRQIIDAAVWWVAGVDVQGEKTGRVDLQSVKAV